MWYHTLLDTFRDSLEKVREYFPTVVGALALLLLGWGIAWVLGRASRGVTDRLLARLGGGAAVGDAIESSGARTVGPKLVGGFVFWLVLMLFVAVWAMMLGIGQIALGWRVRKEVSNEWMLYLGGAVALGFGIAVMWNPAAGALSVLWMIAFFSILFGVSMILLSFRLKGLARKGT